MKTRAYLNCIGGSMAEVPSDLRTRTGSSTLRRHAEFCAAYQRVHLTATRGRLANGIASGEEYIQPRGVAHKWF